MRRLRAHGGTEHVGSKRVEGRYVFGHRPIGNGSFFSSAAYQTVAQYRFSAGHVLMTGDDNTSPRKLRCTIA